MKSCKKCLQESPINKFSTQKSRGKDYINNICCICISQQQKEYRENNKEAKKKRDRHYYESVKNIPKFIQNNKQYRDSRKEQKKEYDKVYRETHAEQIKQYNIDNKENIAEIRHVYYIGHKIERKIYNKEWTENNRKRRIKINIAYISRRLKKDLSFRLRSNVSRTVNKYLKLNGSSKNNNSILQFIPYTVQELKEYLESKFEPWMSWDNWGVYKKDSWKDNDSSTWTWQIDHIISQSLLPYQSMTDENFKKCWSLNNLRPLNSKQNLLDGIRKIR